MLRFLWQWWRFRSVRDFYFAVILFTVLMFYLCLQFNSPWKSVSSQGSWQVKALKRSILEQHGHNDVRWNAESKLPQTVTSRLEELLLKIENDEKKIAANRQRLAKIHTHKDITPRDLKLYENILKKNGFKVIFHNSPSNSTSNNISTTRLGRKNSLNWYYEGNNSCNECLLILCLTFTSHPCISKQQILNLRDDQKINIFPGLNGILSKEDSFCATMTMSKQLPELRNEYISPLCFVLPKQFHQLLNVAQALGYSVRWTVKQPTDSKSSRNEIDPGPKVIDLFNGLGKDQLKRLYNRRLIVQQLQDNPLLISNRIVSVRVYILITSIAPLRAYVHNEGLVFHRLSAEKNFKRISGKTWLLSELWHYLAKHKGGSNTKSAIRNLNHVLLQMLLIVEAAMLSSLAKSEHDICRHCFQLLGVDCVFNSTLHPVILEVNQQPTLRKGANVAKINKVKKWIMADVIGILFPPLNSVSHEVSKALQGVSSEIGILDWTCPISSDLCLSQEDLHFLLRSRQESINQGGFRQLYPSVDAARYGIVIEQLQRQFTEDQSTRLWLQNRRHSTSDLHRLLVNLERWYAGGISDDYYNDIDTSTDFTPQRNTEDYGGKKHTGKPRILTVRQSRQIRKLAYGRKYRLLKFKNSYTYRCPAEPNEHVKAERKSVNITEILKKKIDGSYASENDILLSEEDDGKMISCNNDPATKPFLSSIRTFPALSLQPAFDPRVTDYYVNVSFDIMLLKVWATVLNCQTEARLDDRFGPSRPTNTTLGVGENRITFMVVDISHTEPWIINSYTLVINRLPVTYNEDKFDPEIRHEICSLKQECEMKMFFKESCGMLRDSFHNQTWNNYIKQQEKKQICKSGDAEGRWVLPCQKCSERRTCYWRKAVWHPYDCKYKRMTTNALKKCLNNKKLLFIGDSTNRGMMHYLIERLNGTLSEWDKTHDIRLYDNINNKRTMVSFAYYPQFWLPTNQRPVFDKALYQLIQRSRPLENNNNTILIVGGVHWLATQHLNMLLRAIRVEHLNGIKLVMKTLGAGFHQPVDNVHSLTAGEQQKLLLHNKGLSEFAHHYNFEVIDTFNITTARYKDFMQGKCACHFHRVVAETTYDPHRLLRTHSKYHVEGPINAIYSEILLSRLCSD